MSSLPKVLSLPAFAGALGMFFALSAFFDLSAFAQNRPCANDTAKFCKDVKGLQARMACLKQREAELSPQCQARVHAMATRIQQLSDACQSDVQQFCPNISPGSGRLAKCLKEHQSELSSTCKNELAQARSMRRSTR
jgi:hypothetical protein